MKKALLLGGILFITCTGYTQNIAINNDGSTAHNSAILDVSSTAKGMLVPRMSTAQRQAIISPANGLLIFDNSTNSFWFFANTWKELTAGNGGEPTGVAGGDLSGNYPSPNVVKLQNLDLAAGTPFDKQVMKWDMLNNRWQGLNDSLFLPYKAIYSDPDKLFSITNTSLAPGGASIYGKRNTGSGISPAFSMGVWGDNSDGTGVLGTSVNSTGVYGFSVQNHGVYGYNSASGFAGVYGTSAVAGSYGVMGETGLQGAGILGRASGTNGRAAWFVSANPNNTDPAMEVAHSGSSFTAVIRNENSLSTNPSLYASHFGLGPAVRARLLNPAFSNTANAVEGLTEGYGAGIYGRSESGVAGKFEITNATNNSQALTVTTAGQQPAVGISISNGNNLNAIVHATTTGKGPGMYMNLSNTANTNNILQLASSGTGRGINVVLANSSNTSEGVYVVTEGLGPAAYFKNNNSSTTGPVVKIDQSGTGRGLQVSVSNMGSVAAAIHSSSSGTLGIHSLAQATAVMGQSTGLTGGVGVYGFSSLNSATGIGVKGESYSTGLTSGAVTGINKSTGVGVFGTSDDGVGVLGESASNNPAVQGNNSGGGEGVVGDANGPNAVGVRGIASASSGFGIGVVGNNLGVGDGIRAFAGIGGNGIYAQDLGSSSTSRAALFQVTSASNTADAVRIANSGLGHTFSVFAGNASNTDVMIHVQKAGTGDFMLFENNAGANRIRFDNTGKGFFNGGTQTGGADIAEVFDVEGEATAYEPGDVLVISTDKDRTLTKSSGAYSTLVAGVYATKPGVLMTEETIDADLTGKVPMGVVGVIPTKVCKEGGEIKRGDLLVTSSIPGVAMKADIEKIKPGQLLGKALANYDATGIGMIKVLVNVK